MSREAIQQAVDGVRSTAELEGGKVFVYLVSVKPDRVSAEPGHTVEIFSSISKSTTLAEAGCYVSALEREVARVRTHVASAKDA